MSTIETPVIVTNPAEAAGEVEAPLRDGTDPYRFEMVYDDGNYRAYADTADGLLVALIDGYADMSEQDRLTARVHLAVRTQTTVQAVLNAHYGLDQVTPDEYVLLSASRATPPAPARWDCQVPLVLVDVFYVPTGDLPRPLTEQDVEAPDNLVWLSPTDPLDFVYSLHRVGLVGLGEHIEDLD